MVFGSNTSASSWEPFCRAIAALILEYSMRSDLIKKHKNLLDMLVWEDDNIDVTDMVQATKCPLNPGIPDLDGTLQTYTNVDDILASAVNKQNTLRLRATIIEAMFTVCGRINIKVRQCPLSLEKWEELVVGSVQTVLGLTVGTNRLTVGIIAKIKSKSETCWHQNGLLPNGFSR